ncbi:cupin domain-containing protein [Hydrogenimonas sp.]
MINILKIPAPASGEKFETLLQREDIKIEAIVSSKIPDPSLYDQDHDEAVLLLEGAATLQINNKKIVLEKGDFLYIEAHTPHRVLKTAQGTRWLAIHIGKTSC